MAGFDAWVEPIPDRLVARELQIPSMFLRSDEWRELLKDRRLGGMAERSPARSYWIGVIGADHYDFVLPPSFSPYTDVLGLKGPIPSDRMQRIVDDYLVGFFDRHLLGVGGAVLDEAPRATSSSRCSRRIQNRRPRSESQPGNATESSGGSVASRRDAPTVPRRHRGRSRHGPARSACHRHPG